jgi:hypothetical protein
MSQLDTIAADASASRLQDIVRQAFPGRLAPGIGRAGRMATVTLLDASDVDILIAALDARGIGWGRV